MATTKLKNPEMLDFESFEQIQDIDTFNEHHQTGFCWNDVLGETRPVHDERAMYEIYKDWYLKRFSKLGRALS